VAWAERDVRMFECTYRQIENKRREQT